MTTERLMRINKIYERLEVLKKNLLRIQQDSVGFERLHTQHPWCMLTDEEWQKLKRTIENSYELQIFELSLKFAEL